MQSCRILVFALAVLVLAAVPASAQGFIPPFAGFNDQLDFWRASAGLTFRF